MLRVVDAAAAICGRGYPAAVSVTAELDLADEALPANAGRWTLEIGGGKGQLQPGADAAPGGGSAPLRLGERGFAALYSGTPMSVLRIAGLASGGTVADDDALDSAFAGPAFMVDYF